MATTVRKLTYSEFEKMPEDGFRHEVLSGEEFMTPPPSTTHQTVVLNVAALLRTHAVREKLGRVFVATTAVVLSKHDVVEPDVFFVSKANDRLITPKNVQGAPDLVIEVLSPSTASTDRGRKLSTYDERGVREYWIVDPEFKTVEVHEFGSPRRTRSYEVDQSFESAHLPGLAVSLEEIFRTE